MHFSATYLALALTFASRTLASPARAHTTLGDQATTTGPFSSTETGGDSNLPAQCSMFKQYVPEVVLEAVCSLHMDPGAVPSFNSACFGGGSQPSATLGGGYQQPTMTLGGGYQQPTTTALGGYEGPTTTDLGGYEGETTTAVVGGYTTQAGGQGTATGGFETQTTATY
ncbi:MAG: hypothetical protein Q9170_004210 [Blastenia crenularia]